MVGRGMRRRDGGIKEKVAWKGMEGHRVVGKVVMRPMPRNLTIQAKPATTQPTRQRERRQGKGVAKEGVDMSERRGRGRNDRCKRFLRSILSIGSKEGGMCRSTQQQQGYNQTGMRGTVVSTPPHVGPLALKPSARAVVTLIGGMCASRVSVGTRSTVLRR